MANRLDDRAKAIFLAATEAGVGPRTAAARAGFAWSTFQSHIREDPEFADQYLNARESLIEELEEVVIAKARGGNESLLKWVLINRASDRWRPEAAVANGRGHINAGNTTVMIENVTIAIRDSLTDPEFRRTALENIIDVPVIGE